MQNVQHGGRPYLDLLEPVRSKACEPVRRPPALTAPPIAHNQLCRALAPSQWLPSVSIPFSRAAMYCHLHYLLRFLTATVVSRFASYSCAGQKGVPSQPPGASRASMGGWWLLAAASSVPVPGKARVLQYSANFLQPFQSDSHAIVMPNVCCSQQLKDGRARQAEGCGEVDDSSLNTVRDLRDWFTLEGTQRVLRIRANHASTNLFTYLLTAINQLIVADAAGVTAYIDFSRCAVNGKDHPASGGSNPFHDPNYGDNMWEQYFDAVSTYSPQRTKTATGRRHHQRDVRSLSSARMWELRNQTASSVFTSAYGIYEQQAGRGYDVKWLKGMRERAAGIIKRHIRVKPVIATKVNAFWRGHFADSDHVLGLHIQRPQPEATPIGLEVYAAHIDRWLMAHPDASIFVVCEDSSFVPLLTQVYGDKLVVREARLQTSRDTLLEDHGEHYRRGEEALIDMLLLSKSTFLLKGDADVAEFAVYFNPKLSDNSIDLGYAKAATNPKAGAEVSAVTVAEESEALDAATLLTSDVGSRTAETPLETVSSSSCSQ